MRGPDQGIEDASSQIGRGFCEGEGRSLLFVRGLLIERTGRGKSLGVSVPGRGCQLFRVGHRRSRSFLLAVTVIGESGFPMIVNA